MSKKARLKSSLRSKAKKGFRGYPMGTVALYGPDVPTATKVVVSVVAMKEQNPRR